MIRTLQALCLILFSCTIIIIIINSWSIYCTASLFHSTSDKVDARDHGRETIIVKLQIPQTHFIGLINHMWPDLQNGVFHTHPVYQLWKFITLDQKQLLSWNVDGSEYQHRLTDDENVRFECTFKLNLQSFKFIELNKNPFCKFVYIYILPIKTGEEM